MIFPLTDWYKNYMMVWYNMLLSPLHLINNKIGMPSLDFYKALVAFSFSFMEIREYNPHKP